MYVLTHCHILITLSSHFIYNVMVTTILPCGYAFGVPTLSCLTLSAHDQSPCPSDTMSLCSNCSYNIGRHCTPPSLLVAVQLFKLCQLLFTTKSAAGLQTHYNGLSCFIFSTAEEKVNRDLPQGRVCQQNA